MYSAEDIFEAAHAIRPDLPELLATEVAVDLDQQLEKLLANDPSEPYVDTQIMDLLTQHDTTRNWLKLYLEKQYPPADILKMVKGYNPALGNPQPMPGQRYVCPEETCQQVWYRRSIEQDIPYCPDHPNALLIRSSEP